MNEFASMYLKKREPSDANFLYVNFCDLLCFVSGGWGGGGGFGCVCEACGYPGLGVFAKLVVIHDWGEKSCKSCLCGGECPFTCQTMGLFVWWWVPIHLSNHGTVCVVVSAHSPVKPWDCLCGGECPFTCQTMGLFVWWWVPIHLSNHGTVCVVVSAHSPVKPWDCCIHWLPLVV